MEEGIREDIWRRARDALDLFHKEEEELIEKSRHTPASGIQERQATTDRTHDAVRDLHGDKASSIIYTIIEFF
jgi:hypothetical protein